MLLSVDASGQVCEDSLEGDPFLPSSAEFESAAQDRAAQKNDRRWRKLWKTFKTILPLTSPHLLEEAYNELMDRYAEPHRRFHNSAYLSDALKQFSRYAETLVRDERPTVLAALFFHKAFCQGDGTLDLAKSSGLAHRQLQSLDAPQDMIAATCAMISALSVPQGKPENEATGLFLDITRAALAERPDKYLTYLKKLRLEHKAALGSADPSYQVMRIERIVKPLLESAAIFSTAPYRPMETQARSNLSQELESTSISAPR